MKIFLTISKNFQDYQKKIDSLVSVTPDLVVTVLPPSAHHVLKIWETLDTPKEQMAGNRYDQGKVIHVTAGKQSERTLSQILYKIIFSLYV